MTIREWLDWFLLRQSELTHNSRRLFSNNLIHTGPPIAPPLLPSGCYCAAAMAEKRMTYEQMKQVLQSLHAAECYLARLARQMEAITPGEAVVQWADNAAWKIGGTATHFKKWASGDSAVGSNSGWETEEKVEREREAKM